MGFFEQALPEPKSKDALRIINHGFLVGRLVLMEDRKPEEQMRPEQGGTKHNSDLAKTIMCSFLDFLLFTRSLPSCPSMSSPLPSFLEILLDAVMGLCRALSYQS